MALPFAALGGTVLSVFGSPAAISVRSATGPGAVDQATGLFVPAATVDTPLTAAVQPATPDDVQALPEGDRSTESIAVYTLSALFAASQAGARPSDVVTWQGRQWVVRAVENWVPQAGYARAVCTRVDS